jgi:hypothetical protein
MRKVPLVLTLAAVLLAGGVLLGNLGGSLVAAPAASEPTGTASTGSGKIMAPTIGQEPAWLETSTSRAKRGKSSS